MIKRIILVVIAVIAILLAWGLFAQDKVLSAGSHDAFFEHLAALCGRAFEGKVTYSQELFIRTGMPQSVDNTWHVYIYPGKTFTYRLTREGREFRVDFDLSKPVPPPPPPWGAEKD